MSKRWTHEEDVFLLNYCGAISPDFIAEHDLGRPWGAGTRRIDRLTKSGARLACARMMYARAQFEHATGRMPDWEYQLEIEKWDREEADAIAAQEAAK